METENVTADELTADMLEWIGIEPEPDPADGWQRFADMATEAVKLGVKPHVLRDRLHRAVEAGKMEKVIFCRNSYYRKVE